MKLHELHGITLTEEEIEVQPAADVWTENKDDSKIYISRTVYFVRPTKVGAKYEMMVDAGTKRQAFATLSRADLDAGFTPMRPNQNPDAEGFTQYRDLKEVEAFKFDGDALKVEDAGSTTMLSKGDYLTRKAVKDNFVYEVKKAKDFEAAYEAK